jgi:hypothetical protein
MRTRFSVLIFPLLLFSACSEPEKAVNPTPMAYAILDAAVLAGVKTNRPEDVSEVDASRDLTLIPRVVAISGRVLVKVGAMPSPVSAARVELFRSGETRPVAVSTTTADGRFEFSRKLSPGKYLLKAESRRFRGEMPLIFEKPADDLILEISEKK